MSVIGKVNRDPRDILLAPVVSEKSYSLLDEGKYTFIVDPRANKTEIKIAVEQVFGVKVSSVNTINRQGKTRRTRFGTGQAARTPSARSSRCARAPSTSSAGRSPERPGTILGQRGLTQHGNP